MCYVRLLTLYIYPPPPPALLFSSRLGPTATAPQVPEDIRQKTGRHMEKVGNVKRRFHGTSCSDMCTFFVDLRVR